MLDPRLWPKAISTLARTFGVRGTVLRGAHEFRRGLRGFRLTPRHRLSTTEIPGAHPFAIDAPALARASQPGPAIARAERVLNGEYEAYRSDWRPFPAKPASWHENSAAGTRTSAVDPWWVVAHLDSGAGDIKDLWEPARFAWAYDLVRAFALTNDDRYARAFHERFAQWCEGNPPFFGVHWSCGQETAIRAVALLYVEANLANAASSDCEAMDRVAAVLAASGERIADAIGYAISQRNNHAISEAVGLLVLGARFRGSHPEALRWYRDGRRLLERLIGEQFAEDGWYIQHSFTYLRLVLDQCVVAQRVLRAMGEGLSSGPIARLQAAVRLLIAVMDPATGIVPNHGPNDGAFVHPITLAPYRDFRPVLTAACASFGIDYPRDLVVDEEVLAWLELPAPPRSEAAQERIRTGPSGWAVARIGDAFAFIRAGRYTSRPGDLDSLHVDVRFGSREIIVDPGTFAYNAPAPWRHGLAAGGVHNGVILDDTEPGVRGPRFLWLIWPAAKLVRAELQGGTAVIVAEVPRRVRRVVSVTAGTITVEDTILTGDAKRARVRWLLHPDADPRSVQVDGESHLLKAHQGVTAGWFSPHYGERIPSRYIEAVRNTSPGLRIITHIRNA